MRTVYVIEYVFIDHWYGINQPKDIAELVREDMLPCSMKGAILAFKTAGWEGDGLIEAFWIPPFMFRHSDTYGVHLWHVKQGNNGISFLCADQPYQFPGLADYGRDWTAVEIDEPPRCPEYFPFSGEVPPRR